MKTKKWFFILPLTLILPIVGYSQKKNNKIKIVKVTHFLFYAPMHVAKEKGFFKDEGIDSKIIMTPETK